MLITKAGFRDINKILDLQTDSFGVILVPKHLLVMNKLTGISYYLLSDEHTGNVVGYVATMNRLSDVYLVSIAIAKSNQSNGYGKSVMVWLIEKGHALNKKTVSFHTSVSNTGMLRLAEYFGFTETQRLESYYTRGYLNGDAVKMVKGLGHPVKPRATH